jgi:hypothetical protein
MHVQLARVADTPEIAMTEPDARTLMQSAQNVLRHYSIQSTQKAVDWITFGSVVTFMYTPRVLAYAQRRRDGPRRPPQPEWRSGPAQIFQFHPPVAQPPPPPPPQSPPPRSAPPPDQAQPTVRSVIDEPEFVLTPADMPA